MTPEIALQLFGEAFYLTMLMVAVIVGPSLAVGLLVSTFQAATQINEQTLSLKNNVFQQFASKAFKKHLIQSDEASLW